MAETTEEHWHDSRIRPWAKWLARLNVCTLSLFGLMVLLSGLPEGDTGSYANAPGRAVAAAISFWLAYVSFHASKTIRIRWNDRQLRTRGPLSAEHQFDWADLTAVKRGGFGRGWHFSLGPQTARLVFGSKTARITTKGGFVDRRDYDAIKALAEQKLVKNARTP